MKLNKTYKVDCATVHEQFPWQYKGCPYPKVEVYGYYQALLGTVFELLAPVLGLSCMNAKLLMINTLSVMIIL